MVHVRSSNLLQESRGVDARELLSPEICAWASGIPGLLGRPFWIHSDELARRAAAQLASAAFTLDDRIYLGDCAPSERDHVLRHELVHIAQVRLARQSGRYSANSLVEREAFTLAAAPVASPVVYPANPFTPHPIVWFIAIGVGAYILLRPGVANAPGPRTVTQPSPSSAQIVAESLAIFAIPGGAMALGGRLGLGFLGQMALAGATTNVCLRGVDDVSRGQASPPLLYLFDATTGAVIGYIVPGGFRLIGRAGTFSFDRLATYGLTRAEIRISNILAEEAALAPLDAARAQSILQSRNLSRDVSQWWLNRRGLIVLYRGQAEATPQIFSPLARTQGIAASEAMVARLRAIGMPDAEIAGYTARWHSTVPPDFLLPPGFAGEAIGAAGIPATRIPGIASNFGPDGVIYILRMPRSLPIRPMGWQGLRAESEYVILNEVPAGTIVEAIPASRVSPILVDDTGLLIPGGGR